MGWRIQTSSCPGAAWALSCAAALAAVPQQRGRHATRPPAGDADGAHPIYISVGRDTNAPIGWIEFCVEYKPECNTRPSSAARHRAHAQGLERHGQGQPLGQREHQADDRHGALGRGRALELPDDGYGDCEDYVLLKRRMLMQAGWPREALLITVVRDRNNDGHAVLTVKTNRGEFILDNQTTRPALEQDRLPLRQAAVAVRPQHMGRARHRGWRHRRWPRARRNDSRVGFLAIHTTS